MTRYLREEQCDACGRPHWFRYWVGEHCDSSAKGLSVSDVDLVIHRFRRCRDWIGERDIEHIMIIELKTANERLGPAQRDTLTVLNAGFDATVSVDGTPINVKSRPGFVRKGAKKLVWHGIHLLRVPFCLSEFGPFYWDNSPVEYATLIDILNFTRDPRRIDRRLDIDRRHKRKRCFMQPTLF